MCVGLEIVGEGAVVGPVGCHCRAAANEVHISGSATLSKEGTVYDPGWGK